MPSNFTELRAALAAGEVKHHHLKPEVLHAIEIEELREQHETMLAALRRIKIVMDGAIMPAMRRPNDALAEVEAAIALAEG